MARMNDAAVLCPFYKEEGKTSLVCEGQDDSMKMHIVFNPPVKKQAFKQRYCEGCYEKCKWAETLYRLWDERLGASCKE